MQNPVFPRWSTYLFSASAVILLSWAMSGCRFGNHVEYPASRDQWTGYYETLPRTLQMCVTLNGQSANCVNSNPNQNVPSFIDEVVGNPTIVGVTDLNTGKGLMYDPDVQVALPIYVNMGSGALSLLLNESTEDFWGAAGCTHEVDLEAAGSLDQSTHNEVNGRTTQGKLNLTFEVSDRFLGGCAPALAELRDCYNNVNLCNSQDNQATQRAIQDLVQPFINAGLMTAPQIADMAVLFYRVEYH
ncbi:MAG: hypothetical protein AB7P04_02795 [Bacteriovoracia bacterium]